MNKDLTEFLKKLKEYGLKKNIPNITETNAKFLHFLVRHKKAKSMLEIGTANGYSTIWFADAMAPFNGHITTIEQSEPSFKQAVKNFETAGFQTSITPIFGKAQYILQGQPTKCDKATQQELANEYQTNNIPNQKFDIVFLDAQKSKYAELWEYIKPLLHENSLVIVDDILKFQEKTNNFTEKIKQESNFDHVILPIDEDDGIMLIQQTP